jgi:hypothetical protein
MSAAPDLDPVLDLATVAAETPVLAETLAHLADLADGPSTNTLQDIAGGTA